MKIQYLRPNELHPYEKNPRKNGKAVKYVAESIKNFGFKVPLVIDKNNVIVTGHTRLKAAIELGLDTVPCIVADDLNEAQIKAFRLADNKVSEQADWDLKMLSEELEELLDFDLDFDMSDFNFDFAEHEKNKASTQFKVENILNLAVAEYNGVGKYDIPQLNPIYIEDVGEIKEWIGFNYVLSDKGPKGKAVHFFIDDYQFERVWNSPEKYVEKLKQYECVLTPDFSPYGDMPMATQIYNHYRKHWVGKYWQDNGIKVIPTIRASTDERSLEWYLEGEPKGGIVCISNMWTRDKAGKDYFLNREFKTMKEILKPQKILVYGKEMAELQGVEYIPTFTEKRFKNG